MLHWKSAAVLAALSHPCADLTQALNANEQLAKAFLQQMECEKSEICGGVCDIDESGACYFPDFAKVSQWLTSSSPFCQVVERILNCQIYGPHSCPGTCHVDEEGK